MHVDTSRPAHGRGVPEQEGAGGAPPPLELEHAAITSPTAAAANPEASARIAGTIARWRTNGKKPSSVTSP
jgi:hypothetical protein